jgi:hypothetical protein
MATRLRHPLFPSISLAINIAKSMEILLINTIIYLWHNPM